jgi:hypothetical protein
MVWRREDENPLVPSLVEIAADIAGAAAREH